jgi:hypothetical protein
MGEGDRSVAVAGVIVHPPAQLGRDHLTHTDRILRQGKALVRAIEALGTIDPSGPFERAVVGRRGGCAHLRDRGDRERQRARRGQGRGVV